MHYPYLIGDGPLNAENGHFDGKAKRLLDESYLNQISREYIERAAASERTAPYQISDRGF